MFCSRQPGPENNTISDFHRTGNTYLRCKQAVLTYYCIMTDMNHTVAWNPADYVITAYARSCSRHHPTSSSITTLPQLSIFLYQLSFSYLCYNKSIRPDNSRSLITIIPDYAMIHNIRMYQAMFSNLHMIATNTPGYK
jgi:hypothetical protein